jgi:hypothetical protein
MHARMTRRMNHWDSFHSNDDSASVYLFGNRNVGLLSLCNLMVPGQIGSLDSGSRIENWYARTDANPAVIPYLLEAAQHVVLTLIMGDTPQLGWQRPLSDLLQAKPWVPPLRPGETEEADALALRVLGASERHGEEVTDEEDADARWRREHGAHAVNVPQRQHITVRVDCFHCVEQAIRRLGLPDPFRIWVHLEGETRCERYEDATDLLEAAVMRKAIRDDAAAMAVVAGWSEGRQARVRERLFDDRYTAELARRLAAPDRRDR